MKTKDYGLASLLVCKGHMIIDYARDRQGQVWFEFKDSKETRQQENDFFMNSASVLVQDYLGAQRRLKSLIFNPARNENEHGRISTGTSQKVYHTN